MQVNLNDEREAIARIIDPRGWEPYSGTGYERKAWLEGAREEALAKADAMLDRSGFAQEAARNTEPQEPTL